MPIEKLNLKAHLCDLECMTWRLNGIKENFLQSLLDSQEEVIVLSQLIQSKIDYQDFIFSNPPLKYASRFGTKFEPSVWYGSLLKETAFTEKAFYIFNFLRASENNPTTKRLFEGFTSYLQTSKGIDLTKDPFLAHRSLISSSYEYSESQKLGSNLRNNGVHAFYFYSARTKKDSINVGAFSEKVFKNKYPRESEIWECKATTSEIVFNRVSNLSNQKMEFSIQQFLLNNELPKPA